MSSLKNAATGLFSELVSPLVIEADGQVCAD